VDRLFVYGTLRRGAENEFAQLMEKSARFLSQACIRGRLFRVAHYPGLGAPEDRNDWVKGDVFEGVTAEMLQRLDDYEGPEYVRQLAEITLENGSHVAAFVYLYALPTEGLELIPFGDWNEFISKSSRPE
jgi:gamma-glutamylcyclotransferase (GGCT)/AIG2-like uncharacterized protein YtfP